MCWMELGNKRMRIYRIPVIGWPIYFSVISFGRDFRVISGNRAGERHNIRFLPRIALPNNNIVVGIQCSEIFIVGIPDESQNLIVVLHFFQFLRIIREIHRSNDDLPIETPRCDSRGIRRPRNRSDLQFVILIIRDFHEITTRVPPHDKLHERWC